MRLFELTEPSKAAKQPIIDWLRLNDAKPGSYTINPDLSVSLIGDFTVKHAPDGIIPVQFKTVSGKFEVNASVQLTSLKGMPSVFCGFVKIAGQHELTSLEHFTPIVITHCEILYCPFVRSLKGGPQHVGRSCFITELGISNLVGLPGTIGDSLYLSLQNIIRMPFLDIFNVEELTRIAIMSKGDAYADRIHQLGLILDSFLRRPYGNKRIIDCQSALIDVGFEVNATFGEE
jgi:hypothetical protein